MSFRNEQDFLGERAIPAAAYWGVHTARAVENFPISGTPISVMSDLIRGLAFVKKAAARANVDLGVLSPNLAQAIGAACDDLIAGKHHSEFVVDVIQGGAGTSTNMNANEVIANLALEKMGCEKGDYARLHPNDHVNASQSTNDVYPTALRLALWLTTEKLLSAMARLQQGFNAKAEAFDAILKIGRTQLQDAVPMTLGQEFSTYAAMLAEGKIRLREAQALLLTINLGATAIGTGINTSARYAGLACAYLAEESQIPVKKAENLIFATQDTADFVQLSGVLKRVATQLSKISNDLRLLSSGPQAGLGDIFLPARQAGSSIMPGKVNPVIPEVMNQIAFEVIGNDVTVTMASEAGQLQLNAFEPIMGWSLFKSITHLERGCLTLLDNCVAGIQPNYALLDARVRESVTLVTALNPVIGYEKSALIVKTAIANQEAIADVAERLGIKTRSEIEALLVASNLVQPLRS